MIAVAGCPMVDISKKNQRLQRAGKQIYKSIKEKCLGCFMLLLVWLVSRLVDAPQ
jgi:hypothetical protein